MLVALRRRLTEPPPGQRAKATKLCQQGDQCEPGGFVCVAGLHAHVSHISGHTSAMQPASLQLTAAAGKRRCVSADTMLRCCRSQCAIYLPVLLVLSACLAACQPYGPNGGLIEQRGAVGEAAQAPLSKMLAGRRWVRQHKLLSMRARDAGASPGCGR